MSGPVLPIRRFSSCAICLCEREEISIDGETCAICYLTWEIRTACLKLKDSVPSDFERLALSVEVLQGVNDQLQRYVREREEHLLASALERRGDGAQAGQLRAVQVVEVEDQDDEEASGGEEPPGQQILGIHKS